LFNNQVAGTHPTFRTALLYVRQRRLAPQLAEQLKKVPAAGGLQDLTVVELKEMAKGVSLNMTKDYGLICFLDENERIGEVTRQSIDIIGPPPRAATLRLFREQ